MGYIPKVASINDISGYGRCSLTMAVPVLSVMGVQCCPVPTAILSCHTGFNKFYFMDFTNNMSHYLNDWQEKKLEFDAVYSGFLGAVEQISITEDFIQSFEKKPLCVIDTVMGDNGQVYPTYTNAMCEEMKKLVSLADVITPNVTEACILTGTDYTGENISEEKCRMLMEKLNKMGTEKIVITGIQKDNLLVNAVLDGDEITEISSEKSNECFQGTGDLFASVVTGLLCRGKSFKNAVRIATDFVSEAIEFTIKAGTPVIEGVQFEPLLYKLGAKVYEN